MAKLRILLADDHRLIREGLSLLINAQSGMEVIGEADNGRSAVVLTRQLQPDLVLMDITMPELTGLDATKELRGWARKLRFWPLHATQAAAICNQCWRQALMATS